MDKLKECPFCGNKAKRLDLSESYNFPAKIVHCFMCAAQSAICATYEAAERMWNTRTTPTPPAGQVEAVNRAFQLLHNRGFEAEARALMDAVDSFKASGAEHIAGLAKASIDIASFAQHDEDCHINNWGDNQIPECTCGYTSAKGALCDILEALPPELRGK